MGYDVSRRESKSTEEQLSIDNWKLVKAITGFKCEHEKCQSPIEENEFYILFVDNFQEINLCVKHGIQRVKKQRRMLEVFETKVIAKKFM